MSKYNLEFRKECKPNKYEPVSIFEYTVYQNVLTEERYLLTNIHNQTKNIINSTEYEITQFDELGERISKASYIFENLGIEPFIKKNRPKYKIRVSQNCVSIEAKLIRTSSSDKKWFNGEWVGLDSVEEVIEDKQDSNENESLDDSPTLKKSANIILSKTKLRLPFHISLIVIAAFILIFTAYFMIVYPL